MEARDKSVSIEQIIVDTGSEFTWLPESVLSGIGIKVEKRDEKFQMANGELITRDIGYAILRVNGFETVDEIVFARTEDLSLLGARTLEGFGAIVDAERKRLVTTGPHLAPAEGGGEKKGQGGRPPPPGWEGVLYSNLPKNKLITMPRVRARAQ